MQTSYFRKKGLDEGRAISIARWQPKGFNFPEAKELAPTKEMMKRPYAYHEYIALITGRGVTRQILQEKYGEKILCCWEKNRGECHRGFIAQWLGEVGLEVPEFEQSNKQCSFFMGG